MISVILFGVSTLQIAIHAFVIVRQKITDDHLTLNLSKTVCILFFPNPKVTNIELDLSTIQLSSVENTKFLGMWVDKQLSWKKHMGIVLTKIKQNTNMLKVSNKYLSTHAKKMIYHSHILSHLKNGLLLWGNMIDNTSLNKIQKCLDRCYTLVTHKDSSKDNMNSDGFLTVMDLLTIENCKFGYRHQHNLLPTKVQNLLETDSQNRSLNKKHGYNTRHKKDLNIPQARYKSYHKSYLCKVLSEFTQLPLRVKQATTVKSFVQRLKAHLLSSN